MRNQLALATTTALALALAACGGSPDDAEETSAVDEVVTAEPVDEAADDDAADADMVEADEGETAAQDEGEEDGEEPAPTASATASPTPTPTPTRVAAAGPPQAFTTCGVCHSVEPGQNMIGPTLAGVVGRRAGSVSGANYSPAMQEANITWTEANLRRYILDPNAVVPGGSMPNPGVNAQQAQAIINYLKTL
ncbi:c-type cytochrome [Aurantiacibacter hainanensis]|uniref:c-type cytochrome n=1 Tax=Aurantiacibacter hainanensis TaxID=3076114 RepID=UPI0030C74078